MGITLTKLEHHSLGSLRGATAVATFDNSYPTGGEALLPNKLGMGQILMLNVLQGEDGYVFKWDSTNNKILVYQSGDPAGTINTPTFTGDAQTVTTQVPFFVEEESVSVAAGGSPDTGTLSYVPAYIVSVADSTGVTYQVIPSGETPVDNVSVAVNFTTGVLTFADADDPSAVRVTYFPSRVGTFFDNANAVEETLTGTNGTGYVDFTNRAAVIQFIFDSTTPQLLPFEPVGEAPADNKVEVDMTRSAATSFKNHSGEESSAIKVRYLNHSALTPGITFVDDADVSLTTNDKDFSGTSGLSGDDLLVVPGFGTNVSGEETGNGNENAVWGDSGTTEANNVARWAPKVNLWATANSSAFVTTSISSLQIDLNELTPPQPVPSLVTGTNQALTFTGGGVAVLAQAANGANLSAVIVEIFALGR